MTQIDPLAAEEEEMDSLDVLAQTEGDVVDVDPDDELSGEGSPMRAARHTRAALLDDAVTTELTVEILPQQHDEFQCQRCWLVRHRSQLATGRQDVCADCD